MTGMFEKKRIMGEYNERINPSFVEDIADHAENDYFNGFIRFSYTSLRKVVKTKSVGGIERTITHYVLETTEALPFKKGDVIRINGVDSYDIDQVESKIPKRYETLVAMNPGSIDRYQIKVLTLYTQ